MSKQPETCPHREEDRIRCKSGCCVQCRRCGIQIVGNAVLKSGIEGAPVTFSGRETLFGGWQRAGAA